MRARIGLDRFYRRQLGNILDVAAIYTQGKFY